MLMEASVTNGGAQVGAARSPFSAASCDRAQFAVSLSLKVVFLFDLPPRWAHRQR